MCLLSITLYYIWRDLIPLLKQLILVVWALKDLTKTIPWSRISHLEKLHLLNLQTISTKTKIFKIYKPSTKTKIFKQVHRAGLHQLQYRNHFLFQAIIHPPSSQDWMGFEKLRKRISLSNTCAQPFLLSFCVPLKCGVRGHSITPIWSWNGH